MVGVFIVDVVECVNPAFVVEVDEVDELAGNDVHGMDFSFDPIRPFEKEFVVGTTVGRERLFTIRVSGHEAPHSLRRFYRTGEW